MGTFESFRKAYGALKDSTKVGLAKVNSDFKDLDIAVVKATNHVECPPKERHVRKIFSATSVVQPRADVAYCIHTLARRLAKTRNWVVALKTLIVIHRTLREGDPSFREELVNYSSRAQILQISNFKDDLSPLALDCSAWVRTYALFLEERLECFKTLKYDIESERLTKISPGATKAHSRTRVLSREELLEQLPVLQQLLYRLIGCQPEGAASYNYLVQYALALVLKESFKIYCGINDGIINLVDMFFEMSRHDAVKALNIYKRAGQQAENLANFYEFCKALDLARNFQFPTLRRPPPSFLATMEEYIREAPQSGSVPNKKLDYQERPEPPHNPKESEDLQDPESPKPKENEDEVEEEKPPEIIEEEPKAETETEPTPLIPTDEVGDLLGLHEVNPQALELEQANALALAIVQPGNGPSSMHNALSVFGGTNSSGWELALVTTPTTATNSDQFAGRKLAGGFDKLLLDSLYEDDAARRQLQLQNAGYGYDTSMQCPSYTPPDPFALSNNIAPPSNVQMAMMQEQMVFANQPHHHHLQPQYQMTMYQNQSQQFPQHNMMMVPHGQQQYLPQQYPLQQQFSPLPQIDLSNPFRDPFSPPVSTTQHPGGHHLL